MRHLIVEVGGVRRTISFGAVQEVVRTGEIARVPGGASWVRGLAAVRGRLVPVVDPADRAAGAPALLVIVAVDGRGVGLIVDRVDGVVDDGETLPPPIELDRYTRSAA